MKKGLIVTALLVAYMATLAAKGDKPEKKADTKSEPVVLVVGLNENDLSSNYYGTDDIAKEVGTTTDSLAAVYTKAIFDNLNNSDKYHLKFISLNTLHNPKPSDYNNLIEKTGADYILALKKYEVNYKGEPYYTLLHMVNFDLYNKDSKSILEGQSYFDAETLQPVSKMEKQYRRMANKIALQAKKAIK